MSGLATSRTPDADSIEVLRTRAVYEDFLFHEAALLDEWRLDEWFDLFAIGATYEVPTTGAAEGVDSADELFYVADDYERLRYRVERLKKKGAHAEWPHSTCARLVSNVRVLGSGPEGVEVRSVFATYRAKDEKTDCYFGHHRYLFCTVDGALKIAAKRSLLDMSSLRPHGRVSIIV